MSSQPSNEPPRVIPLADAPPAPALESAPGSAPESAPDSASAPESAETPASTAPAAFTADPLNSLKFRPLIAEQLAKVFDPEIPVNIYELGLIYDIDVDSASNANIRMTLTAPACPAAQTIPLDVERRVKEIDGINNVKVDVVWDPPWTRDRMSETAKLALGML
jgi:FeS assembly SUF system protein